MTNYKNEAEAKRYQYQLTKLQEFRQTMSNKFLAGKANRKQIPEVTIPPLHNDSAPLTGLAQAAILKNRGWL